MLNKLDNAFRFHQTALSVRNQRQEILASNIANADTPHYKAKDIDFQSAMQTAMQGQLGQSRATGVNASGLVTTDAQHQLAPNTIPGLGDARYRPIIQGAVDGNTVDMDVERNAYVDNGIRYEASLTMINGQIKKLMSAITGQ